MYDLAGSRRRAGPRFRIHGVGRRPAGEARNVSSTSDRYAGSPRRFVDGKTRTSSKERGPDHDRLTAALERAAAESSYVLGVGRQRYGVGPARRSAAAGGATERGGLLNHEAGVPERGEDRDGDGCRALSIPLLCVFSENSRFVIFSISSTTTWGRSHLQFSRRIRIEHVGSVGAPGETRRLGLENFRLCLHAGHRERPTSTQQHAQDS